MRMSNRNLYDNSLIICQDLNNTSLFKDNNLIAVTLTREIGDTAIKVLPKEDLVKLINYISNENEVAGKHNDYKIPLNFKEAFDHNLNQSGDINHSLGEGCFSYYLSQVPEIKMILGHFQVVIPI